MNPSAYLAQLQKRYASGMAKEHAYRADLEALLRHLAPSVDVTNEPANVTDCGNPDFVLTIGKIPIGYIEAKDINKDLNAKHYQEQFDRYRKALDNLIITDYLLFRFYRNGVVVHEIRIGKVENDRVAPMPENFAHFENLIADFSSFIGQTIKSPQKLAELMAAKARLLQSILEKAATTDEEAGQRTELHDQLVAFRQILLHDLNPRQFADLYAQTMAYGMFAARLHDPTLDTFTRQEAAELIPKSNPFLRKLFHHIAGPDIDERIRPVVDNLADVFRATDVAALLADFGKNTGQNDPIIHFYETFLAAYDPALRKSRGVWYTPEPVVNFIVRAVDDILKTEFDLPQGLADTSKIKIKTDTQNPDKRSATGYKQEEREVHRVQILDPATGTATFLAEIIKHLHNSRFKNMPGIWSSYVDEHLIPRLHGFELLMASYAMAHLKLDLLLKETGYTPTREQRFKVYLTNSLEEYHPDTGTLFSSWLSAEANEANYIKKDTPVMVVLGNPPYSVSSSNKGAWIQNLIADYKKDLNEKKINLDDDYIKFIRFGQHFIEKNGEGVLAYITNNSFIDGTTHRQMRKTLLEVFDKIYILDLHGNAKKKETAPGGGKDENVFDIMQGVSISILVKSNKKSKKEIYSLDVYGSRENKYQLLFNSKIDTLKWIKIEPKTPYLFFNFKDLSLINKYEDGFNVSDFFENCNSGIQTKRDKLNIQFEKVDLEKIEFDFRNLDEDTIRNKYNLGEDGRDWKVSYAIDDIKKNKPKIEKIQYRIFDTRWIFYSGKSKGIVAYPRDSTMSHILKGNNVGFLFKRTAKEDAVNYSYIFISELIISEGLFAIDPNGREYIAPLYLYPTTSDGLFNKETRRPNLNMDIVQKIEASLGMPFVPEKGPESGVFAPIDLLDYIYAVLHSPAYRETYKEFLKIDFPRVPYPSDQEKFWKLVTIGGALRALHLMESPKLDDFITSYPVGGDNVVGKLRYEAGKVWINEVQYFDGVPEVAWNFYIGGYQPAQKWLKDRKGRALNYEDIQHYMRIVVALVETERLMKEVDAVGVE